MTFDKKQWSRDYYQRNKEKLQIKAKTPEGKTSDSSRHQAYYGRIKKAVIEKFSNGTNQCAVCSEKRIYCLSIDHIQGGGRKHRESVLEGKSYSQFYKWLLRNGTTEDYQVLCMNCQWEKRFKNKEYN